MIKCLNQAIEYIEDHIDTTLEVEDIAKAAYLSKHHFQRMFFAVTGFTLAQYIRNRRLTLAGEALTCKDVKVTDVAIKYGYESIDAFSKAFLRLHGVSPSKIKKGNIVLKSFPKLSFQISIIGACEMNYKIVEKDDFKMFGVDFLMTSKEDGFTDEIMAFCDRTWETGTHDRINEFLGLPKSNLLKGIHFNDLKNDHRRYMLGWEAPEEVIPEAYTVIEVHASTWVTFKGECDNSNKTAIAALWKQIYLEWFPNSGFEQVEGPCIESYSWNNDACSTYTYEVSIPVKRMMEV